MAVLHFAVNVTPNFLIVVVVNKLLTLFMLHNILGLPDYVIGELLSSTSTGLYGCRIPSSSVSSSSSQLASTLKYGHHNSNHGHYHRHDDCHDDLQQKHTHCDGSLVSISDPLESKSSQELDERDALLSSSQHQKRRLLSISSEQTVLETGTNTRQDSSAIRGSITGEAVVMNNCFPGRLSSQSVRITSTVSVDLSLRSWSMNDARFDFVVMNPNVSFGESTLGRVYFDPSTGCSSLLTPGCYTGTLDFSSLASDSSRPPSNIPSQADVIKGYQSLWFKGLSLNPDSAEMEVTLLRALRDKWMKTQEKKQAVIQSSLSLDMGSGYSLTLPTTASLSWPRIIFHPSKVNTLKFPLTRFGDSVRKKIWIENPSSHPLVIQAFVLSADPGPSIYAKDFLSLLGSWPANDVKEVETEISRNPLNKRNFFKLLVNREENQGVYRRFDTDPSLGTQAMFLPVGERAFVEVEFNPRVESEDASNFFSKKGTDKATKTLSDPSVKYSTFVVIRNNLTVIDAVRIEAEAGLGLLKMGTETPGLTSLLTLDLKVSHLANSCGIKNSKVNAKKGDKNSSKPSAPSSAEPQFTVMKQFKLTNYGKIPVNVRGFIIGPNMGVSSSSYNDKSTISSLTDRPIGYNEVLSLLFRGVHCQGFGFKIQNCQEVMQESKNGTLFTLRPNQEKKINIAFTPDFTVAKTMATLTIVTDEGPFDLDIRQTLENYWNEDIVKPLGRWFPSVNKLTVGRNDSCDVESKECLKKIMSRSNISSNPYFITYSLIATVPKEILAKCDSSLPRPYQEVILYYSMVVFMTCLVMVTTAFAFIDGTRILNLTFYPAVLMTRPVSGSDGYMNSDIFRPFKLNEIGKKGVDSQSTSSSNSESGTQASSEVFDKKGNPINNKNRKPDSWTSYLKNKLGCPRRGSGGSNSSTIDSKRNIQDVNSAKTGATKDTPSTESRRAKKKEEKKKQASSSWFESLYKKNEEKKKQEAEEPIRLPSFEDAFDIKDIQDLIGKKPGNKKGKEQIGKENKKTGKTEKEVISKDKSKEVGKRDKTAKVQTPQASQSNGHSSVTDKVDNVIDSEFGRNQWQDLSTSSLVTRNMQDIAKQSKLPDSSKVFEEPIASSLVSPFSDSTTEFGYWSGGPNGQSSSQSGSTGGDVIWDSPITMFEPEEAMKELLQLKQNQEKQQRQQQSHPRKPHSYSVSSLPPSVMTRNGVSSPKSDLCPLGPPPGLTRSESVSEADSRRGGFPPVGNFTIDSLLSRANPPVTATVRPVQTPSPRGWSPSHKTSQQQIVCDSGLLDRSNVWGDASAFLDKDQHLMNLRDGSTNWSTDARNNVSAPVQRPREGSMSSSVWSDSPVSDQVMKTQATTSVGPSSGSRLWDWTSSPTSSTWAPMNQSKPPSASAFSLFGGRNTWTPLWPSSSSRLDSTAAVAPPAPDSTSDHLWMFPPADQQKEGKK